MYCDACGQRAPTKYVEFYQNIGALIMRFHKSMKGNLCRDCSQKYFTNYTLTNLALGWWGVVSLIVNPFFIVNNVVRYLGTRSLPRALPPGSAKALAADEFKLLRPYETHLSRRLSQGEGPDVLAQEIAARVSVDPALVLRYLATLAPAQTGIQEE